jgi:hypothetical protein
VSEREESYSVCVESNDKMLHTKDKLKDSENNYFVIPSTLVQKPLPIKETNILT